MENGPKYIISKEGLVKLPVIACACITFVLLADTGFYNQGSKMRWVFAAFIVSFSISLLLYAFRVTKIANKMSSCWCCSLEGFDGFDFLWSWFSTAWCLGAAVVFVTEFESQSNSGPRLAKMVCNVIIAFLTGIAYGIEGYLLGSRAPAHLGYIATWYGWIKTAIIALGAASIGLLLDSGFPGCEGIHSKSESCSTAITYVLAAFIIAWGATLILWILHVFGVIELNGRSSKVELTTFLVCILLFLSGAILLGAFMHDPCHNVRYTGLYCQKRLSGVIVAAVNTSLYIADSVVNIIANRACCVGTANGGTS